MRKIIIPFFSLFILFSGCSNGQQNASTQNSDKPVVENVDTKTFQDLIAKNPEGVVLDVRTPEEIANGHLANASTINFYDDDFQKKAGMIRKDQPVFVYCAAGSRSAKAAEQMSQMGFTKIYNLQGGFNGWMNAGFEIVKDANAPTTKAETFTAEQIQTLVASNKLVLLDFHTQWCIPCKKMIPVIDELKKDFEGKIIFQTLDADANKSIAENYKVVSVPTYILLKDGKEVYRKTGLAPKEEMTATFNKSL